MVAFAFLLSPSISCTPFDKSLDEDKLYQLGARGEKEKGRGTELLRRGLSKCLTDEIKFLFSVPVRNQKMFSFPNKN